MTLFSGKNKAKYLAIFILMVSFLLLAARGTKAQQVLLNDYNKSINGTLTHTEWNNLLTDFLNRKGTSQLDGELTIGSWPSPQGSLTINGQVIPNAGISAGYIFSGAFGQHTGGGNYSFPGNLGIGTTSPAFKLSVVGDINFTGSLLQNGSPFLGSRWSLHGNGTDIFYNTGNVIVGADESSTRLHVETNSGPVAFFKSNLYGGTYAGYIGNMQTFSLEEFGLYTIPNYRLAAFDQTNGLYLYGGFSDTDVGITIDSLSNNVGIGTTTPGYKLDVAGDINFAGDLFQNGVLFNAAGVWSVNGSNIFYNTGNVGVGTSLPTQKLDVRGGLAIVPSSRIGSGGASWAGSAGQGNGYLELYNSSSGNTTLWNSANFSLILGINNAEVMRLRSGNVGIGVTNPLQKLHVSGGQVRFDDIAWGTTPGSSQNLALTTVEYVNSMVSGSSTSTVGFWTASGNDIYNSNSGNIGLGTASHLEN